MAGVVVVNEVAVTDGGGSLTVDGTVAVSGTVPVSAAALPLPTGAATETTLAAINTKTPMQGQTTMAASSPVVIASNQSTLPVSHAASSQADGHSASIGATSDADTANTVIGRLKQLVTKLAGGLPSALVGNRLDINNGAWLGSTAPTVGQKTAANSVPTVLASDQSAIPVTQNPSEEATYTAIAKAISPGNGKSLLALFNPAASGYVLKLREIYIRNAATTAVTGVAAELGTYAIRSGSPGVTAGTNVTPLAHDSDDALPSGLVCKTGGTVAGETTPELDVMRVSTDEWGPGSADVESAQQSVANYLPARVKRDAIQKPFTIRAGQGIHLKCVTNTTAGLLDIIFIFTRA